MPERAERRRAMRQAGYRRAEGKRGRRPPYRQPDLQREDEDTYEALEQAGFVVARIVRRR